MKFLGRSKELGQLRAVLDRRTPCVATVTGIRGGGKSALVRRVVEDYPHVVHVCPPMPEPTQRSTLARRLEEQADADWETLFRMVLARAEEVERPYVLVLDDVHRLSEARARYVEPLFDVLTDATRREIPLHAVLVGTHDVVEKVREGRPDGAAAEIVEIRVPPLSFRSAAPLLPGRAPDDRVRAYGVFGGIPAVLRQLDRDVGVGTNVRRLTLAPDGPLADAGGHWIDRDLQAPARYYAILTTLAGGEADWGTVHQGVPDLTRSGQVAPYLNKLIDLGLLEARRSLDATPGGRARRYAITDPFLAFWLRFVLPLRLAPGRTDRDQEGDDYARDIRPRLDGHLESVFPMVCRQYMRRDALETLGAVAREGGSLWGPDYDVPVAGILTNGAAYVGACTWTSEREEAMPPLARIERDMRASRFGFGRERRLRIVFTGRPPPVELIRQVARNPDARLIDAEDLMG